MWQIRTAQLEFNEAIEHLIAEGGFSLLSLEEKTLNLPKQWKRKALLNREYTLENIPIVGQHALYPSAFDSTTYGLKAQGEAILNGKETVEVGLFYTTHKFDPFSDESNVSKNGHLNLPYGTRLELKAKQSIELFQFGKYVYGIRGMPYTTGGIPSTSDIKRVEKRLHKIGINTAEEIITLLTIADSELKKDIKEDGIDILEARILDVNGDTIFYREGNKCSPNYKSMIINDLDQLSALRKDGPSVYEQLFGHFGFLVKPEAVTQKPLQ